MIVVSQTGAPTRYPTAPTMASVTTTLSPCLLLSGLTHHWSPSKSAPRNVPEPPRRDCCIGTARVGALPLPAVRRPATRPSHTDLLITAAGYLAIVQADDHGCAHAQRRKVAACCLRGVIVSPLIPLRPESSCRGAGTASGRRCCGQAGPGSAKAVGILIGSIERYEQPRPLKEVDPGSRPPQSIKYLKAGIGNPVPRLARSIAGLL